MAKKPAKRRIRPVDFLAREDGGPPEIRRRQIREAGPAGVLLREATAVKSSWADPDDANERAKTARLVLGLRAAGPLDHMRSPSITEAHRKAASRFAATVETIMSAGYGSRARTPDGMPVTKATACAPLTERALAAIGEHRAACQALGIIATALLMRLLVEGRTIREIADEPADDQARQRREVALGRVVAGLDRLVEHYAEGGGAEELAA